jgi:hypothetical protein
MNAALRVCLKPGALLFHFDPGNVNLGQVCLARRAMQKRKLLEIPRPTLSITYQYVTLRD